MRLKYYPFHLACFLFVLLALGLGAHAEDICDHEWEKFSVLDFDYKNTEVVFSIIDDEYHQVQRYYPAEVCVRCNASQGVGGGAGYKQLHSYVVKRCEYINRETQVVIFWQCHVCEYELVRVVDVQSILGEQENDCLTGGACKDYYRGMMFSTGIEAADGGRTDSIVFSCIVAIPRENGLMDYNYGLREYCVRCGRPVLRIWDTSYGAPKQEWEKANVLTEEEFASYNMPDDLPFQLIDNLRVLVQ